MLFVAEACIGEEEKAALADAVSSGWITMGDRVRTFELAFAAAHGAADAVAVGSCTAGLHLALAALGIGQHDEVLVPSLTFVATVNSTVYCGATPVFVDIEALDAPVMSRAGAATKCSPRTKAVIVVHYSGYVADAAGWRAFADAHGLALIEDSAHAVGGSRGAIFGDAAVFSFFGNKNMTTAEGGLVLARDPDVLARIRQMRSHGMTAGTRDRLQGRALSYDVTMLGYNYRMDDLRAAIGVVQLRHLEDWNAQRLRLSIAYRKQLTAASRDLTLPFSEPATSSHHIMPVILPEGVDRSRVMERMRDAGVQTTIHYPPVHQLSWYRERYPGVRLPRTEEYGRRELTLPLHPRMDEEQVTFVVKTLVRAMRG